MGIHRGPNPVNDGLTFGCDTGYGVADNSVGTRFYPGEPTTNLQSSNQTSGQIAGMTGVSLTYVGEENGYSKYSMSGTFSGGTYPYCMYLPGVSFSGNTAYSTQVKLKTTAPHKFNYFGGGINYVNQAMNSSGTNSSVLQSDGFNYIKREGFNYVSTTAQSGYIHSNPINNTTFNSSTDFIYVKHFQIEQNTRSTPWTATSRSDTASLIDLKRTTSIDVSNVSFDSTGQPTFDNSDDRITMPNSSVFNHTSQLTIESWVKFDGNSNDFIFEKGNVNTQYSLFSHGDDIVFRTWHAGDSGYQTLSPSKTTAGITNGVWHHIVGSWDGSTKRIYVDGVDKASVSKSGALTTNSNGAAIGSFGGTSSGYYFGGDIAIVRIYDKGLSADEVKQNYNAYKNRFDV